MQARPQGYVSQQQIRREGKRRRTHLRDFESIVEQRDRLGRRQVGHGLA